jgi:hypothetical protein
VAELLLIEGMRKGYTRGGWSPVFVDVSLEVARGEIVGHDDGGYLIATVYTKLGRRRALERAQRAMDEYARRHTTPETPRRLHVVASA